jgi:hypothetical protein
MTGNRLKAGVLSLLLIVSVVAGAGALSSGVLAADGSNEDGNDTRANATAMDADSTVSGTIESGDIDWYAVEIEAGQGIYGTLTITTENDENLRFDIFSPDGEKINEYPNDALHPFYETKRLVAGNSVSGGTVAEQSGTYYVRVKGADDGVSEATSYDLTVSSVTLDEYDPNEQPAQATAIDIEDRESVSGVLTGYDRDTYAIDLEKGETVTIDYEQSNGFGLYAFLAGPNASDEMLNPYYKGEYAVASQVVGGPNEFNYTANKSGTYYLRIVPYVEGSTIHTFAYNVSYEMSVSVSGGDDEDSESDTDSDSDDSRANATKIDVGERVTSTLSVENDSDWYAVDLEKGQGFMAVVKHTNREDPGAEVAIDVYDPHGNPIGEAPADRPISAYHTTPGTIRAYSGDVVERSGTHYVRIQGVEGANYSLSVDTVPLDEYDPNEQPAQATSIESGDTISAKLTGYDRDVYAIDVQKGDSVTIDLSQSEGFTTALYVADPTVSSPMTEDYTFEENVSVTKIDPFNDAPATFTANQTGTYYIKVVPYFEGSTATTFSQNVTYEMSVDVSSQSDTDDSTDTDDGADETNETDDMDDKDSDETETETPEDTADEDTTEESDEASQDTDTDADSDADTDTDTDADSDTDESEETVDEEADQSTDDTDETDETMDGDDADEEETNEEETDETATDSAQSECDDEQQTDCPEETTEDDCEEING